MAMRRVTIHSKTRAYHHVADVVQKFVESDASIAIVKGATVDEWASEESCLRSFRRAIRKGYYNVRVWVDTKGRIVLSAD